MANELHTALQQHYAGEDGRIEEPVDAYRADVLVGDVIYEIQTGSFRAIRDKLRRLARRRRVILVYPVPARKFIVRLDPETGEEVSCRRSPKRGKLLEVFYELPSVARLLKAENLGLEVVMTVERDLRRDDGQGSWRRRGVSLVGRELVEVLETHRFDAPADFLRLLPEGLPERFTVPELTEGLGIGRRLAGKMAYTLRYSGVLRHVGKRGHAFLYRRVNPRAATTKP